MTKKKPYNYKPQLGEKIKTLRTAQGISLRKFGLMIGMDYSYIFDIEHGRANASVDALSKIAAGLGVGIKDLFDFDIK